MAFTEGQIKFIDTEGQPVHRCPEEGSSAGAAAAGICQTQTQGHGLGENRTEKVLRVYLRTPPNPACVQPDGLQFYSTVTFTLGARRWGLGCPGDWAGRRSVPVVKDSDRMSRDRVGRPPSESLREQVCS